jgi:hypothetical protein
MRNYLICMCKRHIRFNSDVLKYLGDDHLRKMSFVLGRNPRQYKQYLLNIYVSWSFSSEILISQSIFIQKSGNHPVNWYSYHFFFVSHRLRAQNLAPKRRKWHFRGCIFQKVLGVCVPPNTSRLLRFSGNLTSAPLQFLTPYVHVPNCQIMWWFEGRARSERIF